MIKERCRKKWTIKQQWPLFVKLPEIHQKKGLQDEMVDFGKIGRFSRFRTVCFGFFFGFCWGGSRKKNGRKKYLTSNIVGNGAIEFESLPSKGFREHHWGCFEMDWMRGKEITYCMTYMTYRGLEDFFGRVLLLPCSLNVKWHSQIDRLVIFLMFLDLSERLQNGILQYVAST